MDSESALVRSFFFFFTDKRLDIRVYPESIWLYRISHANMSCCSLCKALSGEHSESAGHVFELPLSFFVRVVELGEAGERVAACCESVCHDGCILLDLFASQVAGGGVGGCEGDGRHGDVVRMHKRALGGKYLIYL